MDRVPARPDALAGGRLSGRRGAGVLATAGGGDRPGPRRGRGRAGRGGPRSARRRASRGHGPAPALAAPAARGAGRRSGCARGTDRHARWAPPTRASSTRSARASERRPAGPSTCPAGSPCGGLRRGAGERGPVLGNDSGPRHLAEAVGTATVGVFTRANLVDVAPLFRHGTGARLVAEPVRGVRGGLPRRPCGHEASVLGDITVDDVLAPALELLDLPVRRPTI